MHPILIELPFSLFGRPAVIHTYGFMVGMGFVAGALVAMLNARRAGLNSRNVVDLCFWLLFAGIAGGKLMFIAVNFRAYLEDPGDLLRVLKGGLVWYGSLLGSIPVGWYFMRRKGLPFARTADALIPGVSLGHAIGRLGCFMAGCCFGRPCGPDMTLGIVSTNPLSASPLNVAIHPVQLYEAAGEMVIFSVLMLALKRKGFNGRAVLLYMMLYPMLRSTTEIFRGDIERGYVIDGVLSTSQFISIIFFIVSLGIYAVLKRRWSGEHRGK